VTAIVLPIWTPAAAWLVLCWLAVLVDVIVKRRRARRRLRVVRDQRGYSFPAPLGRAGCSDRDGWGGEAA